MVFSLLFELFKNIDHGLFSLEIFITQILGILTSLK